MKHRRSCRTAIRAAPATGLVAALDLAREHGPQCRATGADEMKRQLEGDTARWVKLGQELDIEPLDWSRGRPEPRPPSARSAR
jgi:hypothetical protein